MSNLQLSLGADVQAPKRSSRGRLPSGEPNPIDLHVGNRLFLIRSRLDVTQMALGDALGITYQQVQKYESGANRIGASRLWDISQVLDCKISSFYEGIGEDTAAASPCNVHQRSTAVMDIGNRQRNIEIRASDRETVDLVNAFSSIRDRAIRRRVYQLAKSLATPVDAA